MLAIAVDWSASAIPSPRRPSPDAIWIALGTRDDLPPPEYHRTRAGALARLTNLLRAHTGPALLGLDFAFGYPALPAATLPTGRALCAMLADRITDAANNANNRFEVAQDLNRAIARDEGWSQGPFWARPAHLDLPDLPATAPDCPAPKYRTVDRHLRAGKWAVQSAWKLAYPASVGSQTLMGLPAVHRLLTHPDLAPRCRLWPFEPALDRPDEITIAEIWPSLTRFDHIEHAIKDARQVAAVRDAMLAGTLTLDIPSHHAETARREGWIMGVA